VPTMWATILRYFLAAAWLVEKIVRSLNSGIYGRLPRTARTARSYRRSGRTQPFSVQIVGIFLRCRGKVRALFAARHLKNGVVPFIRLVITHCDPVGESDVSAQQGRVTR